MPFIDVLLSILAIIGIIVVGGFLIYLLGGLMLAVLDPKNNKISVKSNKEIKQEKRQIAYQAQQELPEITEIKEDVKEIKEEKTSAPVLVDWDEKKAEEEKAMLEKDSVVEETPTTVVANEPVPVAKEYVEEGKEPETKNEESINLDDIFFDDEENEEENEEKDDDEEDIDSLINKILAEDKDDNEAEENEEKDSVEETECSKPAEEVENETESVEETEETAPEIDSRDEKIVELERQLKLQQEMFDERLKNLEKGKAESAEEATETDTLDDQINIDEIETTQNSESVKEQTTEQELENDKIKQLEELLERQKAEYEQMLADQKEENERKLEELKNQNDEEIEQEIQKRVEELEKLNNAKISELKEQNEMLLAEAEQEKEKLATEKQEVVTPLLSLEEYEQKLEVLENRLKENEKNLKATKKEYMPLAKVKKSLENDKKKLRRKEALVAKQKVVLYGVNNYVDIDEEKAKKLAEDLDLLDGLRLSVQHCEEVMKNNQERYPILENTYNILLENNENIKADIAEVKENIAKLQPQD